MTENKAAPTPVSDPLLLLLNRFSDSQVEQGREIRGTKDEIHEVRRALDVMNARLEPLAGIPGQLAVLQTASARHGDKLTSLEQLATNADGRLKLLEDANSQRKGWETPFGKGLGYLVAATMAALVAFMAGRGVKAAEPAPDLRFDRTANAKCMAAPAKKPPRYLYL